MLISHDQDNVWLFNLHSLLSDLFSHISTKPNPEVINSDDLRNILLFILNVFLHLDLDSEE